MMASNAAADLPRFLNHNAYDTNYLAMDLAARGQYTELDRLLSREALIQGRLFNVWYWAHEQTTQPAGFVRDIQLAWRGAERTAKASEQPSVARQIRYALMTACVTNIVQNVPSELIAELVRTQIWSTAQAIAHIAAIPTEEIASRALSAVADHAPASEKELVRNAAFRQLGTADARLPVLAKFLGVPVTVEKARWREFIGTLHACGNAPNTAMVLREMSVRLDQHAMTDVACVIDQQPSSTTQAAMYKGIVEGADSSMIPWLVRRIRKSTLTAHEDDGGSFAIAELAYALCLRLLSLSDLSTAFDLARHIVDIDKWTYIKTITEIVVTSRSTSVSSRLLAAEVLDWQPIADYLANAPAHHAVEIASRIEGPSDAAELLPVLQHVDARATLAPALARGGNHRAALDLAKAAASPDVRCRVLVELSALAPRRQRRELLQLAADSAWESKSDLELLLHVSAALSSALLRDEALRLADQQLAAGQLPITRYAKLVNHVSDPQLRRQIVATCLSAQQANGQIGRHALATIAPLVTRDMLVSAIRAYEYPMQAEAEFEALTRIADGSPPELAQEVAIDCLLHTVPRLFLLRDRMADAFDDLVGYLDSAGRLKAAKLVFDLAEAISNSSELPHQEHHPAASQAAEFTARALGALARVEPPGKRRDWLISQVFEALTAVGEDTGVFALAWPHVVPAVGDLLDEESVRMLLSRADDVWETRYAIQDLVDPFVDQYESVVEWLNKPEMSAIAVALDYETQRRRWLAGAIRRPPPRTAEVLAGETIGRSLLRRIPRWHSELQSAKDVFAAIWTISAVKTTPDARIIAQKMAESQAAEFRGRAYAELLPRLARLGHTQDALEYARQFVADTHGESTRALSIIAALSSAITDQRRDLDIGHLFRRALEDVISQENQPNRFTEPSTMAVGADNMKGILRELPGLLSSSIAEVIIDIARSANDSADGLGILAEIVRRLGPATDEQLWLQVATSARNDVEAFASQVLKGGANATAVRRVEALLVELASEAEPIWQLLAQGYAANGLLEDVLRVLPKTRSDNWIQTLTAAGLVPLAETSPHSAIAQALNSLQPALDDQRTFLAASALARLLALDRREAARNHLVSSFHRHLHEACSTPRRVLELIGNPIHAVSDNPARDLKAAFQCIQDMRRWWGTPAPIVRVQQRTPAEDNPLSATESRQLGTFLQAQASLADIVKKNTDPLPQYGKEV